MEILKFDNHPYAPMAARLVRTGDLYGRDGKLTNEGVPMIEFYDTRYDHNEWLHPFEGQLISRYHLSTILNRKPFGLLTLDFGIPDWTVNNMDAVYKWLEEIL